MTDLNLCMFIGRLGQDPELRQTANSAVCNFSIATSERWTNKNTGEKQERTEWVRCVAWGKAGEIINQYAHKGDLMHVRGRMETRKWQDRDGQDRYTTEIKVSDFQFLGGGKSDVKPSEPERRQNEHSPRDDLDDDIPF